MIDEIDMSQVLWFSKFKAQVAVLTGSSYKGIYCLGF